MTSKLPLLRTTAAQASQVVTKTAAKASQFATKSAAQASQFVTQSGPSFYKDLLERNKQYIRDPSNAEKCQLLAKQLFYTRLASIPGRYEAFWKELAELKNLLKNRQELNREKAGIAALFGLECLAWFCCGKIIGRGFTITGYHV
ncbi:hypothetical protein SLE2022_309410 [Rubroshorea leprosula]